MPGITKEDLRDADVVDAVELVSDGTSVFISGATVVSTTAATKTIVCSGTYFAYDAADEFLEEWDTVTLSGTSGGSADGTYTIGSIVDNTTFVVKESINDSTGGSANFMHPAGATKVGVDPSNLTFSSNNDLQNVLEDIDTGLNIGHKSLRHLIHFIDDGPACGFASGAYKETLPSGDPFPTQAIWWESSSKLKKIVELNLTRNTNKTPATEEWKMYDTDGSTVLCTVTDTITYSGQYETARTRTIA